MLRRTCPASLFCLVALALAGCAVKPVIPPSDTLDPGFHGTELKAVLRHGDWIVSRGVHAADNMVASVTGKPLSHASLFDEEFGGVIEADGSGVHRTSLEDLLAKSHRVLVIRPLWADGDNARVAVERAREWLGHMYNFTGLVGLDIPDAYYCTQLCVEAYRPFIGEEKPENPIPRIIQPGNMYFWGRILYDSGL
ncbi:MAG: hypothetical protein LBL95_08355 [Deltaproteobacteria bacterium]|jgi:uncharacterized protein YycO|nr:hypothetical protein [Deltaproteobacteria bacterium]